MCLCVHVSVRVWVTVSFCVYVCHSVLLSFTLCVRVCHSVCLCVLLSVCHYVYPLACLCVCITLCEGVRGGWYSGYIVILRYYFEAITVSDKILLSGIIAISILSQFTEDLCMHITEL